MSRTSDKVVVYDDGRTTFINGQVRGLCSLFGVPESIEDERRMLDECRKLHGSAYLVKDFKDKSSYKLR